MDRTQIRSGLVVVANKAFGPGQIVAIIHGESIAKGFHFGRAWLPGSKTWSSIMEIATSSIVRSATHADMQPIEDAAGGDWIWNEGGPRDTSTAGIAEGRSNP